MKKILNTLKKIPYLLALFRLLRDVRHYYSNPVITPLGTKLVGNSEMQSGKFEIIETNLLIKIFSQVDTVINIGANIGYYASLALYHKKNCISFEPLPLNLHYLAKNLYFNSDGYSQNILFPVALGDQNGLVRIYGSGTGASLLMGWAKSSTRMMHVVPIFRYDDLVTPQLTEGRLLVIVDVEGSELAMLSGASSLLSRKIKPIWFIEINIDEHQPTGVLINPNLLNTFLKFFEQGYICYAIGDTFNRINIETVIEIQATNINTINTHNFLFVDEKFKIN